MRIRHYNGTVVDVPEDKARAQVSAGTWTFIDRPSEKLPEPVEEVSEGDDTGEVSSEPQRPSEPQEPTKPVPTIPEMRAWALKEGIEGVKDKGKLSRHAIEAYLAAHKE